MEPAFSFYAYCCLKIGQGEPADNLDVREIVADRSDSANKTAAPDFAGEPRVRPAPSWMARSFEGIVFSASR